MPDSWTPPRDVARALVDLGHRLREARLRRNITAEQISERIGVTRKTLGEAEKGKPTSGIGVYASYLWALGLLEHVKDIATLGREPASVAASTKRRRARQKKAG